MAPNRRELVQALGWRDCQIRRRRYLLFLDWLVGDLKIRQGGGAVWVSSF